MSGIRARAEFAGRVIMLAGILAVVSPRPAVAGDLWCWLFNSGCGGRGSSAEQETLPDRSTPEIDPGLVAGAIALAAGGAAMLSDRVRRRRR